MPMSTFPPLDLGPIGSIVGRWKGKGRDVAFLPGGVKVESDYLEEMTVSVAPIMRITQTMFVHAAAYQSSLVDATTGAPLHQESGYWAWVPESQTALRIIALGRALGVVATSKYVASPAGTGINLSFKATRQSTPCGIATASIGVGVPTMEELVCDVTISGNTLTYDQVSRVQFGPGQPLEHTDNATLFRQP